MDRNNTNLTLSMDDFSKELHTELMHEGKRKLNEILKKHDCITDKELLSTMMWAKMRISYASFPKCLQMLISF
mgnify:CR=1 FL=1